MKRWIPPLTRRKLALGLFFISPWLIGFIAFTLYPIYYTLRISFTRYSGFGEPMWVGWANYQALFNDSVFLKSLENTFIYTALAVPIGIVVAMAMAIAMNQPLREVPIYRAALYLPSILPLFATAFIFIALLDPSRGIINQLMVSLGLPNINWFGDPRYAKLGIVLLAQLGAGGTALIFLAGLKAIPITLYEAAVLDGASPWRRFWSVTLPLMTPVILYSLIAGLSGALQVFAQAYIITNGGPADATNFYVFYLYNQAFRYSNMGAASAMAWILFIITFILSLLIFRTSRRWVNYETIG